MGYGLLAPSRCVHSLRREFLLPSSGWKFTNLPVPSMYQPDDGSSMFLKKFRSCLPHYRASPSSQFYYPYSPLLEPDITEFCSLLLLFCRGTWQCEDFTFVVMKLWCILLCVLISLCIGLYIYMYSVLSENPAYWQAFLVLQVSCWLAFNGEPVYSTQCKWTVFLLFWLLLKWAKLYVACTSKYLQPRMYHINRELAAFYVPSVSVIRTDVYFIASYI